MSHEPAWGIAIASRFLAVGARTCWGEPTAGVVVIQAYANTGNGKEGVRLLQQGLSADATIEQLMAKDRYRHLRQMAVIDWAGSSVNGYPLFDTISFGESVGRSASRLRRDLLAYCEELRIAPRHSASYVCAALGAVVLKADCFPKPRFINLCSNMCNKNRNKGSLKT